MTISTHILDISLGRPAPGVPITLAGQRQTLTSVTDSDGRCRFSPESSHLAEIWGLRFDTAIYYAQLGMEGLYPFVLIHFVVTPGQTHYHIPLLLTANGYTTYRGS